MRWLTLEEAALLLKRLQQAGTHGRPALRPQAAEKPQGPRERVPRPAAA